MEKWELSKDEIMNLKRLRRDMIKLDKDIIKKRGEVIQLATEIESELDELIVYNFIRTEYGAKFFEMLMWEDFKFFTKIKLFGEIEFSENIRKVQKNIVRELEELSKIRNKFAIWLSLVIPGHAFLIDKKNIPIKVDNSMLKDYRERCKNIITELRAILISQKGLHFKDASSVELLSAKIKHITSEYEEKDIRKKYQKNAETQHAHK